MKILDIYGTRKMGTLQGQHIQKHDPTKISEYEFQAGLPKNNIRAFGCGEKIRLQDPQYHQGGS